MWYLAWECDGKGNCVSWGPCISGGRVYLLVDMQRLSELAINEKLTLGGQLDPLE